MMMSGSNQARFDLNSWGRRCSLSTGAREGATWDRRAVLRRVIRICFRLEVLAMAWLLEPACSHGQSVKPNFLVVLSDDLGYGDIACFGNPVIKTPCLDKLASEGMKLTACYASAPVCSPSRCGMLTGRIPNRMGIYDWIPNGSPMHLQRSEITVATLLKKAGYDTCHVGKWHCNGMFNSAEQPPREILWTTTPGWAFSTITLWR